MYLSRAPPPLLVGTFTKVNSEVIDTVFVGGKKEESGGAQGAPLARWLPHATTSESNYTTRSRSGIVGLQYFYLSVIVFE